MPWKKIFGGGFSRAGTLLYRAVDALYLRLDKAALLRSRNIRLIPQQGSRRGGKRSYAEWAHVIGIFQTLIYSCLEGRDNCSILDVGCGTGLLAIASEPFLGDRGRYLGIDVWKQSIDFCRSHFAAPAFDFIHLAAGNAAYAPRQEAATSAWPVESASFDLVTALSVWTHLNEDDARFYLNEVARVLKPDGRALITFFMLDELYREGVKARSGLQGRYHMTSQDDWVFDRPAYGSQTFFHPKWAPVPESAIAITKDGLMQLVAGAGLELVQHYPGNWKEVPGVYFQDVLVFRKAVGQG